jgi:hypothetical protein
MWAITPKTLLLKSPAKYNTPALYSKKSLLIQLDLTKMAKLASQVYNKFKTENQTNRNRHKFKYKIWSQVKQKM